MEQLVLVALDIFASRTKQLSEWNYWFSVVQLIIVSILYCHNCLTGQPGSCDIIYKTVFGMGQA